MTKKITLSSGNEGLTEALTNGGFENDLDGWTVVQSPSIRADEWHSGAKCLGQEYSPITFYYAPYEIYQTINTPVANIGYINLFFKYGYWLWATNDKLIITYTDATTQEWILGEPFADNWTNLRIYQAQLSAGKTISKITLKRIDNDYNILMVDDVSVMTYTSGTPTENITNGNFDSGNTGWTNLGGLDESSSPSYISDDYYYSFPYSVWTYSDGAGFYQSINNISADDVTEFSFRGRTPYGGSYGINFIITYTDETTTAIRQVVNSLSSFTKYYLSGFELGKTIKKLTIWSETSGPMHLEDVSLKSLTGGGISLQVNAIDWSEEKTWAVAMRDVPKKNDGTKVDTGIKVVHPKNLNIIVRLSDSELETLLSLYNLKSITITAVNVGGTWTYSVWFTKKPKMYQYAKEDDAVREWRVVMEFIVTSTTFTP